MTIMLRKERKEKSYEIAQLKPQNEEQKKKIKQEQKERTRNKNKYQHSLFILMQFILIQSLIANVNSLSTPIKDTDFQSGTNMGHKYMLPTRKPL